MTTILMQYWRSELRMLPTLGVSWVLFNVFALGWLAANKALPFAPVGTSLSVAFAIAVAAMTGIVARTALRTIGNGRENWLQRAVAILVVVLLGAALNALVS